MADILENNYTSSDFLTVLFILKDVSLLKNCEKRSIFWKNFRKILKNGEKSTPFFHKSPKSLKKSLKNRRV